MKKLLFFLGISLALTSGLQAVSRDDLSRELLGATNTLKLNAFDSRSSMAQKQQVVTAWDDAVAKIKKFVMDNSKDLLKREDPILTSTLSKVQNLNNDFTNTIKVIRGSLSNPPISRLLGISSEAKKLYTYITSQSFTLTGKKEANSLLALIVQCIRNASDYFHEDLSA